MTIGQDLNAIGEGLFGPREDYWTWFARNQIREDFGHEVSVVRKAKGLRRSGRNDDVDTGASELIWVQGGLEVLPTSGNPIDTISSSDAGDNQLVRIEGHTRDDASGDLTFVVQFPTLNGQNKVTLGTPLHRAVFLENAGATDFAGDVRVYQDGTISGGVPTDPSTVHLRAAGSLGSNRAEKCATSLSSEDYWLIKSMTFGVGRQASATCNFRIQTRLPGGVFLDQPDISADNDSGPGLLTFEPHLIVRPNSDVQVIASASANNAAPYAILQGALAVITQRF